MCSATSTVDTEEQAFHAVGGQKYNNMFPGHLLSCLDSHLRVYSLPWL